MGVLENLFRTQKKQLVTDIIHEYLNNNKLIVTTENLDYMHMCLDIIIKDVKSLAEETKEHHERLGKYFPVLSGAYAVIVIASIINRVEIEGACDLSNEYDMFVGSWKWTKELTNNIFSEDIFILDNEEEVEKFSKYLRIAQDSILDNGLVIVSAVLEKINNKVLQKTN
ncbi:MAG: hypothetical protein ACRCYE_11380 [Sarcina sp.]